jgi:hypothetical protein
MESLKKKKKKKTQIKTLIIKSSLSQIKITVESLSSRLEQVEDDRISGLQDKVDIMEKAQRKEYEEI